VQTDEGWLLLAGDAYFHHGEKLPVGSYCPPLAAAYQNMMDADHGARVWNQKRIRDLMGQFGGEVTVFCSHDRTEFEDLKDTVHETRFTFDPIFGVEPEQMRYVS
jgi:hypothetical protein